MLADVLREADRLFESGQGTVEIASASTDARFRFCNRPGPVGPAALRFDENLGRWRSCNPDGTCFSAVDVLADDWEIASASKESPMIEEQTPSWKHDVDGNVVKHQNGICPVVELAYKRFGPKLRSSENTFSGRRRVSQAAMTSPWIS
jgi:hypothetical protein